MGALLGALSSLCVGGSEFFGRRSSQVTGVLAVAVVAHGVACIVSVVTLPVIPSAFSGYDVMIGAASGIGYGFGMVLYLGGLLRSSATVVAPVVAVLTVVIPVGYASMSKEVPSAIVLGGVALAALGLFFITSKVWSATDIRRGILWSCGSGIAYGFGLSILLETDRTSGAWPGATQRLVACVVVIVMTVSLRRQMTPQPGARWWAVLSGIGGGAATLTYILAVQADPVPAAVMTGALFPALSVALGRLVFGDEVRRSQGVGLALTLLGIIGVITG